MAKLGLGEPTNEIQWKRHLYNWVFAEIYYGDKERVIMCIWIEIVLLVQALVELYDQRFQGKR